MSNKEFIKNIENKSLENIKGEIWKWVIGYEGIYKVSNRARIKSVDRNVNHWRGGLSFVKGKILSQIKRKNYLEVNLIYNGLRVARSIHQLVGEVFVKNPYNFPIINHEDGITINNLPYNLVWCDNSYNILHAYRTGLIKKKFGEDHHNSKLTNIQRCEIIKLLKENKMTYNEIGKLFNVCAGSVWYVKDHNQN